MAKRIQCSGDRLAIKRPMFLFYASRGVLYSAVSKAEDGELILKESVMAIVDIFAQVEELKRDLENLSIDDLQKELESGDLLLLDIREIQEVVDLGTIPSAIHVPRGMMEF